jgi:radical SAM protein (TIGR01212 family)
MIQDQFPWDHSRRFNAYAQYFKKHFGERVQKLTVDAGFTCPNRDGTVARGGCTYCNNDSFNPSYNLPSKSIQQQLLEGIEFHNNRYRRADKYLAYFQAYSNTYKPLDELKIIYNQALALPEIVGLVIGTRSDVIDEEKLAYFAELSQHKYVIIEYGIESCYDESLRKMNRGHNFESVRKAIHLTHEYGIKTGAHMIFGLPYETREMMMEQVDILNELPLDAIKFHQLQIIKGTAMAKEYTEYPDRYQLFSLADYIDFIVHFVERLNPNFAIERFAGEVPPRFLVSPSWGNLRNDQILNRIEQRLQNDNTWQGRLYKL